MYPHRLRRAAILALRSLLLAVLLAAVPARTLAGDATDTKTFDGPPFEWPTAGRLTQDYGCTGMSTNPRRGSCPGFHNGIDLANAWGTRILAAADGIVEYVGWDPYTRWGERAWVVIIRHDNGLRTWYAHLLPRVIEAADVGDAVIKGQLIGRMGMTGHATGVHLHLMVERARGEFIDPRGYFAGPPPRRFLEFWELLPLVQPEVGVTIL